MEAIINMHSMSSVYEQGSMHHRVCMDHCIVILSRDNPVCFSIETDHGVFEVSGIHKRPNCSQEIPSNMKATHAQDELTCFFMFFFCRPSTSKYIARSHAMMVNYWPCFVETSIYRTDQTAQSHLVCW